MPASTGHARIDGHAVSVSHVRIDEPSTRAVLILGNRVGQPLSLHTPDGDLGIEAGALVMTHVNQTASGNSENCPSPFPS